MKKTMLLVAFLVGCFTDIHAQSASSLTWAQICAGRMSADWYGSAEAQDIADVVLYVQKTSGGWMKNDQLHKLSDSEKQALYNKRNEHSCLDNVATTQEMRFLAKVYQKTGVQKYKDSFMRALAMIFTAEKGCGGWSQYWPLTGNGSYQDHITFNDDLTANVMKLLRDIATAKGDFEGLTDEATRTRCQQAFDRTVDMIIRCQINDNGTPAAWCAQHDTISLLPVEGRPHELPSVSGSESASLLSLLMTIEKPSEALQNTIHSAVAWLDAHKIADKAVEDFTNENGEADRRVIDKAGSAIWGRFIQLGGETGQATYDAFFTMLKNRNKKRSYTYNGRVYTYTEYEIATTSYNPEKAYQPIYAIYDETLQHLYYRFLYNYEDTPPEVDDKGLEIPTSLNALRRTKYQFLGSWALSVIQTEYPAWKDRIANEQEADDYTQYVMSADTYTNSGKVGSATYYYFNDGFSISNAQSKAYGAGLKSIGAIKYSAGVYYTIHLPEGLSVEKVKFYGYDNYNGTDAYISSFDGKSFSSTQYVFPAKDSAGNATLVGHTLDVSDSSSTSIGFMIGGKQCGLVITVYCKNPEGGTTAIRVPVGTVGKDGKWLENRKVTISKNGNSYHSSGVQKK